MARAAGETVRGAEQRPGPGGGRSKPLLPLSGGEELAPRGPRAPGAAMVAGSRWRPRRLRAASARAEEVGREFLPMGFSGAWVRATRAGMTAGRRTRESPFPLSGTDSRCLGLTRSGLSSLGPPRTRRVWAWSRLRAASVPRAWSGVAPRPGSPWAAGSFVPAPRCPLFLPSAGRRGREEGGSGCPDVSALNDCVAGQSQPGVCGRWAPCLPALGVGALPAALGGRPGAYPTLESLWGDRHLPCLKKKKIGGEVCSFSIFARVLKNGVCL